MGRSDITSYKYNCTVQIQGIILSELKILFILVDDQTQYDMIVMNESYRRLQHLVSRRENIQFHILNDHQVAQKHIYKTM